MGRFRYINDQCQASIGLGYGLECDRELRFGLGYQLGHGLGHGLWYGLGCGLDQSMSK